MRRAVTLALVSVCLFGPPLAMASITRARTSREGEKGKVWADWLEGLPRLLLFSWKIDWNALFVLSTSTTRARHLEIGAS
jgi:hypothetical protein